MKKSSPLWSRIVSVIQIITILLVLGVIWQSLQPAQDAGDGIALGIFAGVIVMPLYLISTILVVIFHRTKKHIILACIPLVLIAGMMLYDRMTHMSHFDPANYQYLVGQNISSAQELFQKASGGTGETEIDGKKGYTLPGMTIWVDKDENIITINSDN